MLCAACLAKFSTTDSTRHRAVRRFTRLIQVGLGILIAWFFFFALAETLQRIPDDFHEGNIWQTP